MSAEIKQEIEKLTKIQLRQEDFGGQEGDALVYCYKILNTTIIVKCFQTQETAQDEMNSLQNLEHYSPGIFKFYVMKNIEIEMQSETSVKYVIFLEPWEMDMSKRMSMEKLSMPQSLQKEQEEEVKSSKATIEILQDQVSEVQNPQYQPTLPKNLEIPSFSSDIIKNSDHIQSILALFENTNFSLKRIHQQLSIELFDAQKFHEDCDGKGSTLVIMHSNEEPNNFFGGMAAPSWNSNQIGQCICDPAGEYSWLFKIEVAENMVDLHQWKCIKKENSIVGDSYAGPVFGAEEGGFGGGFEYFLSYLPSNQSYEKVDLAKKVNGNAMGLLFQLKNKINFAQQVKEKIMSEQKHKFVLDSCEVFVIKKL